MHEQHPKKTGEETFSYPPFQAKSSWLTSLIIELIVFVFVVSPLTLALISGVEFVEENAETLLIRLIIAIVLSVAVSIAAGIVFRKSTQKKQKAEWEAEKEKAYQAFLEKQKQQALKAEWEEKCKREEEEFEQNFHICEFCSGQLSTTVNDQELYTSFVPTDYTLQKTGYNKYKITENGFNAKHSTGTRKISCPTCGYRIISNFNGIDVGGRFGYKRNYLTHEVYPDVNSPISKEQLYNGRLYKNIRNLP